MSANTSIEWTDRTWNPVTGCRKVSPGCTHCYAEGVAMRFWATQYPSVEVETSGPAGTMTRARCFTDVMCHEDRLLEPLSWRKPQKVFVNSMSDLFHEDVPFPFIAAVFGVMAAAPQHTFQVLTKRPARMLEWFAWLNTECRHRSDFTLLAWQVLEDEARELVEDPAFFVGHFPATATGAPWPLPNVWLGVSVEDQQRADERIPLLMETPAAVRFISAEPLLGPVDFSKWFGGASSRVSADSHGPTPLAHSKGRPRPTSASAPEVGNVAESQSRPGQDPRVETRSSNLHLVIVGGESGPGARPCRVAWIRDIVAQCRAASVAVFVKQLGTKPEGDPRPPDRIDPVTGARTVTVMQQVEIRSRKGNDPSEWPEDLRVREFPR